MKKQHRKRSGASFRKQLKRHQSIALRERKRKREAKQRDPDYGVLVPIEQEKNNGN